MKMRWNSISSRRDYPSLSLEFFMRSDSWRLETHQLTAIVLLLLRNPPQSPLPISKDLIMTITANSSFIICIGVVASLASFPHAFVSTRSSPCSHVHTQRYRYRCNQFILHSAPDNDRADGADDDDDDDPLLDELRDIKKDKYGADIPTTDELQNASQNAENAFLSAMLEQTQQFKQIKADEGSDKAIEVFMGRMQEADEEDLRSRASEIDDEKNDDVDDKKDVESGRTDDSIQEKKEVKNKDNDGIEGGGSATWQ